MDQQRATLPEKALQDQNERCALAEQDLEPRKSLKFWLVFFSLCLLGLSTALEATIVTTALPTITEATNIGSRYAWVGNAFLLPSAVIQPFIGQMADLFGRRWPLIIVTACFVLGSGVAGGANGARMLIGGRTIQGVGAGGILVLIDVVVSDLVPLRERAKFLGLVRITGAIGSSIGPIVGGALAKVDWRWCFYLNIVTGGLALVYLLLLLDLKYDTKPKTTALARIDYGGAGLFMASVTSLLLGLVMGGVQYRWGSANIIVPLVLGVTGWAGFHIFETTPFCKDPMVPGRIFMNTTSAAGFFMAFDGALLLYWVIWILPVYFQGVLGTSPLGSGINQLPLNMFLVPSGIVAGGLIAKTGRYKPQHHIGFALISIGIGLFTLLGADTSKVAWVCYQIIVALGLGIILTTVLPAIQVARADADIAKTTAMYAFVRSFGGIWGVSIPSVIFNGQINKFLYLIDDPAIRQQLVNGQAYGFAAMGGIQKVPTAARADVLLVYTRSLRTVWQVGMGFALAGFLATLLIKQYSLKSPDAASPLSQEDESSAQKVYEAEKSSLTTT